MVSSADVKNAQKYLDETVADHMTLPRSDVLIGDAATFGEASARLITVLFVTSPDNKLRGMLTSTEIEDAKRRGIRPDAPILDVANRRLVTLYANNSVGDATRVFAGSNPLGKPVSVIPVIDMNFVLLGYLEAGALLSNIIQPR